jgi:hypothetical protein
MLNSNDESQSRVFIDCADSPRKIGHQIASGDLRSTLFNYRIPSDAALQQAFQPVGKGRMLAIQTVGDSLASAPQGRYTRVA